MTRSFARGGFAALAVFLITIGVSDRASAVDREKVVESCRASKGRPVFLACMHAGGSREMCMGKSKPLVHSCVKAAMIAARPKAVLFDAAKISAKADEKILSDVAAPVDKGPANLVAPPRTVADITAILDQEKPDPAKIAKLNAAADEPVPPNLKSLQLAGFLYKRAQARAQIGRNSDALADAELTVTEGQGENPQVYGRYQQFLMHRLREAGQRKRAQELAAKQMTAALNQGKGRQFGLNFGQAIAFISKGDTNAAEAVTSRNRTLLKEAQRWKPFPIYGMNWQAIVEDGAARVAEARGRFADAEAGYHKAGVLYASAIKMVPQWENKPAEGELERHVDWSLAMEGRAKVKQGRVGEGEADVRRALLSRLNKSGKFHIDTAGVLGVFVYVIQEQGRYAEAEQLQRQVIEIYRGLGYADDSLIQVRANVFLAQIVNLQQRYDVAAKLYDQIDGWTVKWDPRLRDAVSGGLARVSLLLAQGNAANAMEIAQRFFDRERRNSGDKSLNTAIARGFLATTLARSGKSAEALAAYQELIPVLLAVKDVADDDSGTTAAASEGRVRFIVEAYLRLLSRNPQIAPANIAEETFGYADVLRGQSVQRALQASSARATITNPELAQLVRKTQDGEKQIGAAVASLNNLLTVSSSERDEKALKQTQAEILRLRTAQAQALRDLARKFPDYANLINPAPPQPADIQKHLRDDEAFLSIYFGRFDSFIWTVRKGVPLQFARLDITLGDLNVAVTKLREALEPHAAMISDIPVFDVALAHDLYSRILKPTEESWKPAKSLIVVTNGALGLLPLSLLPTAPSEVKTDDDPLFASYRNVPWLARTHAVTLVPSASALLTLRNLPPGKSTRQDLIAFGDPYFSKSEQAAAETGVKVADAAGATRGVPLKRRNSPKLDGVASADLAMLPRLPDTADELKSIAVALQADPSKVLNLGKDANEKAVKTMDLSGFKILAFATHGLVPGELDGLTQPALALSSPEVTGNDGDGLLTMSEILSLKLDADWVVLSACNTGAGAGAGAEAASGLGRAFFYAGTRALLVTNWSVHSQSARELVTDLFKRQADDPKLTRGEALRQAMMALADGPGYLGADGKSEFAYAHPLFWAPYSIIGDGGGR